MTKQEFYEEIYRSKRNYITKKECLKKLKKLDIPKEKYINLKMFVPKLVELPEEYTKVDIIDEADVIITITEYDIDSCFEFFTFNHSEIALLNTALEYNIPYLNINDLIDDSKKLEVSKELVNNFHNLLEIEDDDLILVTLNNYKLSENPNNTIYNLIFCLQLKKYLNYLEIDISTLKNTMHALNLKLMTLKYEKYSKVLYSTLKELNIPLDSLVGLNIKENKLPIDSELEYLISYVNKKNNFKDI